MGIKAIGITRFILQAKGVYLLVPFVLFPVAWAVGYSLLYSLGGIGYLSRGWTAEHWQNAFSSGSVGWSLGFSIYIAAMVTLLVTLFSLGLLLLAPSVRRHSLLLAMACVLMGTPGAIVAFITSQILSGGGLLSRIGFHSGVIATPSAFPQLVNDALGVGIMISLFFSMLPLVLLYYSQLWDTIQGDSKIRLAESLGASTFQARIQVALPILFLRGRSLMVLVFLLVLGSFETPLLLGRQSPQMISVFSQRPGMFNLESKPQLFVLATIYFVLCCILLVVYLRGRRRYEH